MFFFFFILHCLWIYPAPCGLTSVLWELYCYDLLHLGVSKQFWSRCEGAAVWSKAIYGSKAQLVEILLLVTSFHFFPLFFFKIFLFLFYCAFIVATKRGILENFETYFGNLLDTPLPSPSSSIMDSETHNNHDENRRTMYELLNFVFPNNIKYQKI